MLEAGFVLAVGVIGYLLGGMHVERKPDPVQTSVVQRDAQEPEWLRGLRSDLRALSDQLQKVPDAASTRAPATAARDDSAALEALLMRLESQIALLESAAVTAHAAPPVSEPKALERLERDSLKFAWQAESGFAAGYDDWTAALEKELTRSYELWTLDQVLSVFGRAWSVEESNGRIFRLEYPFRRLDDSTSLGIVFQFASDRVLHATVDLMDTSPR